MENLRVLEGSEVFFRGLQHLYHQFKSGWRLLGKPGNAAVSEAFFDTEILRVGGSDG